jgi:hypothetical protein
MEKVGVQRTFDGTINAADKGGLEGIEAEAANDNLALVAQLFTLSAGVSWNAKSWIGLTEFVTLLRKP